MYEISLSEIMAITGGDLLQGNPRTPINALSIDSRQIKAGELFVAIKGERFDGHQFINQVVTAGAAAVLIHESVNIPEKIAAIKVIDTQKALGDIAKANRLRNNVPVIGITGSNGKTTTKDLVAGILEQSFNIVKNEGNFNNEIGLPLTLLRISPDTEAVIVEMGMRGLGQICHLAKIAVPNIGIVTNVGLTHLELLGTQENIAQAKGELIEALPETGLAILNGDDPYVRAMQKLTNSRVVLYGIDSPGLDYRASDIKVKNNGSQFKVHCKNEVFEISIPVPGRHNILNALAAIAAAKELGLDNSVIKRGLARPEMSGKRLRIVQVNDYWVIDDTYNASPTSVKAALDVLAELNYGHRKIAVLADMLELGDSAPEIHREIGEYANQVKVDQLFGYGKLAENYVKGFLDARNTHAEFFFDKQLLMENLKEYIKPGDVILVKGSRGMKMEEVVEVLTKEEAESSCR